MTRTQLLFSLTEEHSGCFCFAIFAITKQFAVNIHIHVYIYIDSIYAYIYICMRIDIFEFLKSSGLLLCSSGCPMKKTFNCLSTVFLYSFYIHALSYQYTISTLKCKFFS